MSLGFNPGRRAEVMTRKPGDLPRRNNVHGRGVPVCRSGGRVAAYTAMCAQTRAPNSIGAEHVAELQFRYQERSL